LDSAFQKHGGWIEEFCTAIFNQDSLDAAAYEKDNHCELGKWLYGEGKAQYGKFNTYSLLVSKHAAFHEVAGRIVQAINAKEYKSAEDLLCSEGEYASASRAVHSAIMKLKEESHL
jgi:methyl-accepting chemotaxis protein